MESPEVLAKMSTDQSTGIKVEVTDVETQTSTTYHAIKAAARALSIDKRYIEHYIYLNQDKPVLGKSRARRLGLWPSRRRLLN